MCRFYIKAISFFIFLIAFSGATLQAMKLDSLGLPGDDFDLYAALEMFKKSDSPEDLEKALNNQDNHINNLDLNDDNKIDYIRVVDYANGNSHSIALQAVLSDTETQDVAVIEMERTNDMVHLQIVGDEDLYGKNYIIEPIEDNTLPNQPVVNNVPPVVVNVSAWPAVQYIYAPGYRVWISPYHWRVRPPWWRPWRPVYWNVYYKGVSPYHVYYRPVQIHRTMMAHQVYYPNRSFAPVVKQRTINPKHYGPRNAPGSSMDATRHRTQQTGQQNNVPQTLRNGNNNSRQKQRNGGNRNRGRGKR